MFATLEQGEHLCSLYYSTREMLSQAIPYLVAGLRNRQQCIYVADEHSADVIASALTQAGIDVDQALADKHLKFWTRSDYRQDGDFNPKVMRDFIASVRDEALSLRFAGVRLAVEMTWSSNCGVSDEGLIRWEDLLNTISYPGSPVSFLCQYNATRFSSTLTGMAVEVHPNVVLKDQLCRNLHYRPADTVLAAATPKLGLDALLRHLERNARSTFPIDTRVLDALPVAVYICDSPSGTIRYYNQQALTLWKRDPAWFESDHQFCAAQRVYVDGVHIPADSCPMALCVREGKSFRNVEATFERPDGSRIEVLVNIGPIKDEQGKLIGAINVLQDITERLRAESTIVALTATLQ
jgi:PAS domain-containing protein